MTTLDIVHYTDRNPGVNEKKSARETRVYAGGPAANAAVAFAQLGGEAELVSLAGSGSLTALIETELRLYGVHLDNRSPENADDPVVASVMVNTVTGDRSVVGVKPSRKAPESVFHEPSGVPDVVLFDTYYPEIAEPVLQWAKNRNIPVVLDGGSWKTGLGKMLGYIDYAVCSEKFFPPGCQTPDESASYLLERGVPVVCITRGEKTMLLFEHNTHPEEIPAVPAEKVVDTLGAGDIFHGAFCFHMVETAGDIRKSLTSAAAVASKSVGILGPRLP
jgi:sugar/nucleoside kinase (ribokinase family)